MENNPIREIPVPLLLNQILHAQTYWVMQCMKEVDLKPGQAGCLFILSKEGRLPQKEIAKKLGVKPPSITALLKKLEARGLIVRSSDEQIRESPGLHLATRAGAISGGSRMR